MHEYRIVIFYENQLTKHMKAKEAKYFSNSIIKPNVLLGGEQSKLKNCISTTTCFP